MESDGSLAVRSVQRRNERIGRREGLVAAGVALLAASGFTAGLGESAARAAEPTIADCLAANEASIALRGQHKLRAASAQLVICSATSCPTDIRNECVRRAGAVSAATPTIVFEAKDAAGRDLTAVRVTMDGQALVDRLDGTPIAVDPGEHVFAFEAAGQGPVEERLTVRDGEKDRRERVLFVATAPVGGAAAPATDRPASAGLGTQRIAAIAAASVGVAGVAVGAIFGIQSASKHDQAQRACPDVCADQTSVDLWSDAQTAGNVSTIAFVVGAAGLVGGAILWFTAKPAAGTAPAAAIGLGPGSIALRGAW
jgi:hypothetical protein